MQPKSAIAVDEVGGMYQFALGARIIPFSVLKGEIAQLEILEYLVGWNGWTTAIRTDQGDYFVDGEPAEFGLEEV